MGTPSLPASGDPFNPSSSGVRLDELSSEGEKDARPVKSARVARRYAQLSGDLIAGKSKAAKAMYRDEAIQREIPAGVCAQLLHQDEFAAAPSSRRWQDPFDQIPRTLQLALCELVGSRPSPPWRWIERNFLSRQVVGAVRAPH